VYYEASKKKSRIEDSFDHRGLQLWCLGVAKSTPIGFKKKIPQLGSYFFDNPLLQTTSLFIDQKLGN
jgi:hypothetical protein